MGGLDVFYDACLQRCSGLGGCPFEYASLPINILWGLAIWHEIPTVTTLAGAALTLLSGLYILVREQKMRFVKSA